MALVQYLFNLPPSALLSPIALLYFLVRFPLLRFRLLLFLASSWLLILWLFILALRELFLFLLLFHILNGDCYVFTADGKIWEGKRKLKPSPSIQQLGTRKAPGLPYPHQESLTPV